MGKDAGANFEHLKGTVRQNTVLSVVISKEGTNLELRSVGGSPSVVSSEQDIPNVPRFFPVVVLSQREIYAVSESREARLKLVDGVVQRELDELTNVESSIRQQLQAMDITLSTLGELIQRKGSIETDIRSPETPFGRVGGAQSQGQRQRVFATARTG